MPTVLILPWRWTRRSRPEQAVLFASRFNASGMRARWRLLVGGARLRRAVLASPGALGVSLRIHPLAGHFYTLSMWEDEASIMAFARSKPHRSAVRSVRELGPGQTVLVSRPVASARPRWKETLSWVATAEPGPYRRQVPAS